MKTTTSKNPSSTMLPTKKISIANPTKKKEIHLFDKNDEKDLNNFFINGSKNPFREEAVDLSLNECVFYIFIKKHSRNFVSLNLENSNEIWDDIEKLYFKEVENLISMREKILSQLSLIKKELEIQKTSTNPLSNKEYKTIVEYEKFLKNQLEKRPDSFQKTLQKYDSFLSLLRVAYKKGIFQPKLKQKEIFLKFTTTNSLSCERVKINNYNIFQKWSHNHAPLDNSNGKKGLDKEELEKKLNYIFKYTDEKDKQNLKTQISNFFEIKEMCVNESKNNSSEPSTYFFSSLKIECSDHLKPDSGLLPQNLGLGITIFKLPSSFVIEESSFSNRLNEIADECEKYIKNHNKKINPHFDMDSVVDEIINIDLFNDENDVAYLGSDKNSLIFLGKTNSKLSEIDMEFGKKTSTWNYYLIISSYCESSALRLWERAKQEKMTIRQIFSDGKYSNLIQNSYRKRCALAYIFFTKVLKIDANSIETSNNPLLNLNSFGKMTPTTIKLNSNNQSQTIKYVKDFGNIMLSYLKETPLNRIFIYSNQMDRNDDHMYLFQHDSGEMEIIQSKFDQKNDPINFEHKNPTYSFKDYTLVQKPSDLELKVSTCLRNFIKYSYNQKNSKWMRMNNFNETTTSSTQSIKKNSNDQSNYHENRVRFLEHTHSDIFFSTTTLEYNQEIKNSLKLSGEQSYKTSSLFTKINNNLENNNRFKITPIYYRLSTEDPSTIPNEHFILYIPPKSNYFYLPWRDELDKFLLDQTMINLYNKSILHTKCTKKENKYEKENSLYYYPMDIEPSFPFFRKIPTSLLSFIEKNQKVKEIPSQIIQKNPIQIFEKKNFLTEKRKISPIEKQPTKLIEKQPTKLIEKQPTKLIEKQPTKLIGNI